MWLTEIKILVGGYMKTPYDASGFLQFSQKIIRFACSAD
jgi:hypothetical protein